MHSSVMTNKKYVPFAEENTVEVISMDRLPEAIEKKERNAETYKAKRGDEEVELMVEFPSLTAQEMIDLHSSQAGQFNNTGKVPYTSIVDPHTLKEETHFLGGTSSSKIMESVLELRKKLTAEHGNAITRPDLNALKDAETTTVKKCESGDFAGALTLIAPLQKKSDKWGEDHKKRLATVRDQIVTAATAALEEVEKLAGSDAAAAKTQLGKLLPKLKGTGLEAKAQELQKTLKGT